MPSEITNVIARFNIDVKGEKELKALADEVGQLDRKLSDAKKGSLEYKQAQNELAAAQGRLHNALSSSGKDLDDYGKKLRDNSAKMSSFTGSLTSLAKTAGPALGALFAVDAIQKYGRELIALEKKYSTLFKTVQRYTKLEGRELRNTSARLEALARTYGKTTDELVLSVNAFAKQTKTEFVDALELVELGFLNGADQSGEFLSNLQEYPVQLRNAGLSARQFVQYTVQAVRGGVFSDKLLDSVKELDLRLKELTKTQIDALKPLGETFTKDIVKQMQLGEKSTVEIFKSIAVQAKAMGLTVQDVQTIIADIGGGALEDLGGLEEAFKQIDEAAKINLDTLDALAQEQQKLLKSSQDLASEEARLAKNIEGLGVTFDQFWLGLQTRGLSVLNDVIEGFQKLSNAAQFNIGRANQGAKETNSADVAEALGIKDLDQIIEKAQARISRLNKELENDNAIREMFGGDDTRKNRILSEVDALADRIDKAKTKINELNAAEQARITKELENEKKLEAIRKKELEDLKKKNELAAKNAKAYADYIKELDYALRESEADLLNSKVLKFELDKDKVLDQLADDIDELRARALAANIPPVEVNAEIVRLEETARNAIKKLNRELDKYLKIDDYGVNNEEQFNALTPQGPQNLPGTNKNGKFDLVGREIVDAERAREIQQLQNELLLQDEQKTAERKKEIYADLYNNIMAAASSYFDFQRGIIDDEINYRENRIEYLSNVQSASAEAALEKELALQEQAIQKQRGLAQAQRAIAGIETGLNIAVGISKIFAETGVGSLGFLPVALSVLGGLMATIPSFVSSSLPAFRDGVIDFKGKGTGTSDSNLAMISNGESVITDRGTNLAPRALDLINRGKLTDAQIFANLAPIIGANSGGRAATAEEIAKALNNARTPNVKAGDTVNHYWDERGYHKHRVKQILRDKYIENKR